MPGVYPRFIIHHYQCISHPKQLVLDDINDSQLAFVAGIALACLAQRCARGPFSVWLAHLPGTIAHELAHYVVALITRSSPEPISLRLRRSAEGLTLGSVTFRPGLITGGAVALAPLWVLPLIVIGLWLNVAHASPLYALVAGYTGLILLFAAMPSRADWAIALRYPVGALASLAGMVILLTAIWPAKG